MQELIENEPIVDEPLYDQDQSQPEIGLNTLSWVRTLDPGVWQMFQ